MTDRAAAGCDLFATQLLETPDRRLVGNENGEPLLRLPDRGNRLDRDVGRSGKGEGRIADQPGLDRARA
jgi:hypothetical protein